MPFFTAYWMQRFRLIVSTLFEPVSYTHLDVYKRQSPIFSTDGRFLFLAYFTSKSPCP